MNGKGDGNYHGRQQCSDRVMDIRWRLAFEKLTDRERLSLALELSELEER